MHFITNVLIIEYSLHCRFMTDVFVIYLFVVGIYNFIYSYVDKLVI
jgi:hypothetical protein